MAFYYFDSSGLVKRYVNELGSGWILTITSHADNEIYIARITGAEVVSAFTRRARSGEITSEDARISIANFKNDFYTR